MAKLRMAHASTHGARKPPGPIGFPIQLNHLGKPKSPVDNALESIRKAIFLKCSLETCQLPRLAHICQAQLKTADRPDLIQVTFKWG